MTRIYFDRRELVNDAAYLLDWLEDSEGSGGLVADYRPLVDVTETDEAVEVIADLPGVRADALRVVMSGGTLLIAGEKRPSGCENRQAAFHLAERKFGRFSCALRLTIAIDAGRARASLTGGELHIVLPRIADRRGTEIPITVQTD